MGSILIFEPDHSGHRFHYVRLIAQAAIAAGYTVALATTRHARASAQYREFVADLEEAIEVDAWIEDRPIGGLKGFRTSLSWLRLSAARAQPDRIIVPYADGLAQVMGLAGRLGLTRLPKIPIRGLLFRCGAAYPPRSTSRIDRLKLNISARTAAWFGWERLFHLDVVAVDWYRQRGFDITLLPDPVEAPGTTDRIAARQLIGIPTEGPVIGVVGILDERKGVGELLDAFIQADVVGARLLLAGKVQESISSKLDGPVAKKFLDEGRIILFDAWVEHEFMLNAISAMDVVCTPYPRHMGSASILLRAAAAGRPVLGSDFGWIAYMVKKHKIGRLVDVTDPSAFAEAVTEVLRPEFQTEISDEGMRLITEFHTVESFGRTWLED